MISSGEDGYGLLTLPICTCYAFILPDFRSAVDYFWMTLCSVTQRSLIRECQEHFCRYS